MLSNAIVYSLLLPVWSLAQPSHQAVSDTVPRPAALNAFQDAHEGLAVFTGEPGQWDSLIRERGWIMRDGDQWRMWYTGYNPDVQPLTMKLGMATSSDGIHWQRHPGNPLIDDFWVEDMMVVAHDDQLFMFAEGAGDQAQLLTSRDGISWSRRGPLDVRLQDGRPIPPGPYGTPTAFHEDGTWYLFYERRDAGIWLARSTDMQIWTNVTDEPIIIPGPDDYDALMIALNQVVRVNGQYVAVLHGTGTPQKPRAWCTTLAVSDDLIHWQKTAPGPLLPIADNKSSGQLVRDGAGFLLYTMHAEVHVHRVIPAP
jgi:hypothetical protein